MTDSLFFVFVLVAIVSYGIQVPLNIYFARQLDGLIVTVYRNLSLLITMAPLLFFVSWAEIREIQNHLLTLALASASGVFAFISSLTAGRYLPIGIASSIRQAVYVSAAIFIGALLLGEYMTALQLLLLSAIVASAITLTLLRNGALSGAEHHIRGTVFAVCAGLGHSVTFYFFSILSRELHPFVAGYFWEGFIGIFALLYLLALKITVGYTGVTWLPLKKTGEIAFISLLTISGSVAYSYAVNHGPYALASGLVTTSILVTTLISWFLFKEYLSRVQLFLIGLTVALILCMRLV